MKEESFAMKAALHALNLMTGEELIALSKKLEEKFDEKKSKHEHAIFTALYNAIQDGITINFYDEASKNSIIIDKDSDINYKMFLYY